MIFREVPGGVEIRVKAVPGSTRSRIVGRLGDALKVAVGAPAERGKANQVLIKLLAEKLQTPASAVTIRSGQTGPRKRVFVAGVLPSQCERLLRPDG